MNFLEMQTMTRIQAGDTDSTDPYYSLDELKTTINEACIHIAKKTRSLQTYKTKGMNENEGEYPLPKDYLQIKDVRLIVASSGQMKDLGKSKTHDEFQDIVGANPSAPGEPFCFNLEFGATKKDPDPPPGTVNFYYRPNATYVEDSAGFQYRIWYYQMPTKLVADGDTTELHKALHMTVCYYAALMLTRKMGDMERQASLSALYAESIQEDEEFIHKMNRTGGTHIKPAYGTKKKRGRYPSSRGN